MGKLLEPLTGSGVCLSVCVCVCLCVGVSVQPSPRALRFVLQCLEFEVVWTSVMSSIKPVSSLSAICSQAVADVFGDVPVTFPARVVADAVTLLSRAPSPVKVTTRAQCESSCCCKCVGVTRLQLKEEDLAYFVLPLLYGLGCGAKFTDLTDSLVRCGVSLHMVLQVRV